MERLISASLREMLNQVGPAIASGTVNIISVEAIRERSEDRWPRKREQVVTFVERAFSRLSQPGDVIVPLNDWEFLTIQPGASRTAALGFSANLLRETLEFFLGAASHQDLRLFQVNAYINGELGVRAVAPGQLISPDQLDIAAPEGAAAAAQSLSPPCDALTLSRSRTLRLVVEGGLAVEVAVVAEPVWNVPARAVASYLLRPTVSLETTEPDGVAALPAELSSSIAGDIALQMIAAAVDLLEQLEVKVALHLTLPVRALTYSLTRYRVLHALRDLSPEMRKLLILEIVELSDGLPQSRMAEIVASIAPFARAVLARAPSAAADLAAWRGCGLNGATLDCSDLDPADRQAQAKLATFVRNAAQMSKACVAYGLASRALVLAAWSAGFTHVNGPGLVADALRARGAVRLQPIDLFAADLADRR
ncbi:hypothetical protein [Phenylobacterium sp.]|jgi:hypothetical protein|uniref:hypothetical protein n=1 Tax=Phenylobacterium sp. TaxID=1871053 RepID=UPI002E3799A4|nr:hypothetical protein [Phenylobacterium sp.]HEX3364393.1 hypothetical protein [Phenylobacterium sp.]